MSNFNIPVVLFCFKRVDTTLKVLERISQIKPMKLYILSDAGRNEDEIKIIKDLREKIEKSVNWNCKLVKVYADQNKGVYSNIALGVKYVFSFESEAIFLEDDNLPELSFFYYCKEMLEKYKDNKEVLWICGTNYEERTNFNNDESYSFTKNILPCGWASWKEKFLNAYDFNLEILKNDKKLDILKKTYYNKSLYKQQLFNARGERYRFENNKRYNSWDTHMAISIRVSNSVGIVPKYNQIKNIGVDELSTHGGSSFDSIMTKRFCGMNSKPLKFPLNHPKEVLCNIEFEKRLEKTILYPFSTRIKGYLIRLIKRLLGVSIYIPIRESLWKK